MGNRQWAMGNGQSATGNEKWVQGLIVEVVNELVNPLKNLPYQISKLAVKVGS
jgi:hypothetical protein